MRLDAIMLYVITIILGDFTTGFIGVRVTAVKSKSGLHMNARLPNIRYC